MLLRKSPQQGADREQTNDFQAAFSAGLEIGHSEKKLKVKKTQGKNSITQGKNSRFQQIFSIEKKYILLTNKKGLQRYENVIESVINYVNNVSGYTSGLNGEFEIIDNNHHH